MAFSENDLNFNDLTPQEFPVTLVGEEYKGRKFVLVEASGAAATRYRNALTACHVYNEEGRLIQMKNLASLEPMLVSDCLFEVVKITPENPKGRATIPQSEVAAQPARVQNKLFRRAKEISDLFERDTPIRDALEQALDREGSPISFSAFRSYVNALEGDDWSNLRKWVGPSVEEQAKNEPSGTEAGSDSPTS